MEYIVILDFGTHAHGVIENSHGFVETFADYDDAKAEGKIWKQNGDCKDFTVFKSCTDKDN